VRWRDSRLSKIEQDIEHEKQEKAKFVKECLEADFELAFIDETLVGSFMKTSRTFAYIDGDKGKMYGS
jgi:hypothetical protein